MPACAKLPSRLLACFEVGGQAPLSSLCQIRELSAQPTPCAPALGSLASGGLGEGAKLGS